jgi:methylated-DNA-[protein]-cysteine S-methyltransferase
MASRVLRDALSPKVEATSAFTSARLETPIGTMLMAADESDRLACLGFFRDEQALATEVQWFHGAPVASDRPFPPEILAALSAYFSGELEALASIPCRIAGSEFWGMVWRELQRIPVGSTISYGELARRVGRPSASRAVGRANGANPIAVVVPCHRVIGANGSLTGYGSGLERKRWLLEHEGAMLPLCSRGG